MCRGNDYVFLPGVAAVLGVSERTVYRMVDEGRFPFPELQPHGMTRRYAWRPDDLFLWTWLGRPNAEGFERTRDLLKRNGINPK